MITFTQKLTADDIRAAAQIHFKNFRIFTVIAVIGALLCTHRRPYAGIIGTYLYLRSGEWLLLLASIVYILVGIRFIVRRRTFGKKTLKNALTDPLFGKEERISITDDGMLEISCEGNLSRRKLRELYGYAEGPAHILLYSQKILFNVVSREALGGEQGDELIRLLAENDVRNLRRR
jgi:hypothetical protein